jgi:AcrR family transcriptional regulator
MAIQLYFQPGLQNLTDPMTPRPRETSDQELLAATARVMQRLSPSRLTLADVAKEAGVVPATLIQRFGTKRDLLLANCKAWTSSVAGQFAAARAKYDSPLKTLIELYVECSSFAATPDSMANSLAYLQIDLTDPDFHAVLLTQYEIMHIETRKLLDQAIEKGELKPCYTAELSRLIQQVNAGAMLDWAVYRKGSLASWLRKSLEAVIRAHRRVPRRRRIKPRL